MTAARPLPADDDIPSIGHNNPPPDQPKTLKERLAEAYAPRIAEVEAIAARANNAPKKVKNDDDVDAVGVIVKDARALFKTVDGERKAEKEPFDQAAKDVQAFFATHLDRLTNVMKGLTDRATLYQQEKAAEERRAREEQARKQREREAEERRKAEEAEAAGKAAAAAKAADNADLAARRAAEAERKADVSDTDLVRTRGASGTLATSTSKKDVRIVDFAKVDLERLRPYLDREHVLKAARAWLRVTKGTETIPGLEVFDDVKATFR